MTGCGTLVTRSRRAGGAWQVLLKEAGITPKKDVQGPADTMTLESAIRVIQLNERGRQGRQRAKFMKEIRANEEREKCAYRRG